VDHPNVIKLREVFFGSRTVYLVMELCQGGELFDEITHNAQRGLGEVFCYPTAHNSIYLLHITLAFALVLIRCLCTVAFRVMPQS
jgi:serine/threonine protein kinase